MTTQKLNRLASYVITVYKEHVHRNSSTNGMKVNPIVSELATWYEKVRNAMDYRDEEVVLRAAIERILKRRHFYGGNGKTIASPLLRELTWARYFPDGSMDQEVVKRTEETIHVYLRLRELILQKNKIPENDVNKLIYHLLSSQLAYLLRPNKKRDTLVNFMYHILTKSIRIKGEDEVTRDVQTYIATRRSFAKDDAALISYHLFTQYFGIPNRKNIDSIAENFTQGFEVIKQQLRYPLRHRIFGFVKRNTAPFFILEEILNRNSENLSAVLHNEEKMREEVYEVCTEKYQTIQSKVRRAILRSVIFVLLTKTFVALGVEGTLENVLYGEVSWLHIGLNIAIPPILLGIASLFIRAPGDKNTERIFNRIQVLLFDEDPHVAGGISINMKSKRKKSFLYSIFSFLWLAAFFLSFGLVILLLTRLHFNIISQAVFLFYLAIVAFLIYRIYQTANAYTVEKEQSLLSPVVDFFFMPIARVGRYLTEGVSQVNVLLLVLDFLIEAPFKGLFAFFEQWFAFLHSKREYLD